MSETDSMFLEKTLVSWHCKIRAGAV